MATLKDKMYDLVKHVRNCLNDAVGYADGTQKYTDFEAAMKEVKVAERKLKAVRAHVRTYMRKTKAAFQAACPHESKVPVQVSQSSGGVRTVEVEACTACSKSFDLREESHA